MCLGVKQLAQYCETGGAVDSMKEGWIIINCLFLYRSKASANGKHLYTCGGTCHFKWGWSAYKQVAFGLSICAPFLILRLKNQECLKSIDLIPFIKNTPVNHSHWLHRCNIWFKILVWSQISKSLLIKISQAMDVQLKNVYSRLKGKVSRAGRKIWHELDMSSIM